MNHFRRAVTFISLGLLVYILGGCAAIQKGMLSNSSAVSDSPHVSVFLTLRSTSSNPALLVHIKSIDILSANGVWLPLKVKTSTLAPQKIGANQVLLAQSSLPEGSYSQIRLVLASVTYKDNSIEIVNHKVKLHIRGGTLSLSDSDSKCLFISWDAARSLSHNKFNMAAVCKLQSIPLTTELLYVACPDINTVFIIRCDNNWVCGSIGVAGRPSYIDVDSANKRLYILTSRDDFINVYDINSYSLIDRISIPLTVRADFMTVDLKDGYAFLLDSKSNSVARVDLSSGSVLVNSHVGYQPIYAQYMPLINRLVVCSTVSQAVYFLDPSTLDVVKTISVSSAPKGVLLWNDLLYITDSVANSVIIYNINSQETQTRFSVGVDPIRFYQGIGQIYVSNYGSDDIDILVPGQMGIAKDIAVGNGPQEMACSHIRHWLYVACRGSNDIYVIDPSSASVSRIISVGSSPLGLAALQ